MEFSQRNVEGGIEIVVTSTLKVSWHLDDPQPHVIIDGVYFRVKRLGPDTIQVGTVVIRRSMSEGVQDGHGVNL